MKLPLVFTYCVPPPFIPVKYPPNVFPLLAGFTILYPSDKQVDKLLSV